MFYGFYSEEVKSKIIDTRAKLLESGSLPPENEIEKGYKLFQNRFAQDILRNLKGKDLIETIFNASNRDSLAYWLEYKSDETFKTRNYGSISGGSAMKYILFKRKADQKWAYGQNQQELDLPEAIKKGGDIRDAILRGADLIEKLDGQDENAYLDLQEQLDQGSEYRVGQYGWIHKYYHMLFPNVIDLYHATFLQEHILCCLGHKPQISAKLYPLTGELMRIVNELRPLPTAHTETVLLNIYGEAIKYYRIGTTAGVSGKSVWDVMRQKGHISIGWHELGDLQKYATEDDKHTKENLRLAFEPLFGHSPTVAGKKINEIIRFFKKIKEDDLVTACEGETLLGIGRVLGPYEFFPELDFPHTRKVEWLYTGHTKLVDPKENVPSTVRPYNKFDNILNIRKLASSGRVIIDPGHLPPLDETIKLIEDILKRKSQVILYGPPGTGKTYYAEKAACEFAARKAFKKSFGQLSDSEKVALWRDGLIRMCCFHPSYGYEDFIEGIKPEIVNNGVLFKLSDGIFKKICLDAKNRPDQDFYLIIDEINRGDISRIFGELITLIEHGKRGVRLALPVSGQDFQVPKNIYLIGTMNTADRSIALLDIALRRRFGFREFLPQYELLDGAVIGTLPLAEWLRQLNNRIRQHLGREARNMQIGHSYFMVDERPVVSENLFKKILAEDILPLLEEYCCGDYDKLAAILGSGLVDPTDQTLQYHLFAKDKDFTELEKVLLETLPGNTKGQAPSGNSSPGI